MEIYVGANKSRIFRAGHSTQRSGQQLLSTHRATLPRSASDGGSSDGTAPGTARTRVAHGASCSGDSSAHMTPPFDNATTQASVRAALGTLSTLALGASVVALLALVLLGVMLHGE